MIIPMKGVVTAAFEVLEQDGFGKDGSAIWKCRCLKCGRVISLCGVRIRNGVNKSCGCIGNSEAARRSKTAPEPQPIDGAKWIPLSKGAFALVDAIDFDRLSKYNWCLSVRGYAVRRKNSKVVYLHQEILGARYIDHRNLNKLDNRKNNLRKASTVENGRNKASSSVARNPTGVRTSTFKGVCWSPRRRHWRSTINIGGKQRSLGVFADEKEAARAYNAAAHQLFGEFAFINQGIE